MGKHPARSNLFPPSLLKWSARAAKANLQRRQLAQEPHCRGKIPDQKVISKVPPKISYEHHSTYRTFKVVSSLIASGNLPLQAATVPGSSIFVTRPRALHVTPTQEHTRVIGLFSILQLVHLLVSGRCSPNCAVYTWPNPAHHLAN